MLFDAKRHEAVTETAWNADAARAAISTIVRDAVTRFSADRLWPMHPLDSEGEDPPQPFTMLYFGATGVIWLDRARHFAMHAIAQSERHVSEYGMRRYSLWTGDLGLAIYVANCLTGGDRWPNLDQEDGV